MKRALTPLLLGGLLLAVATPAVAAPPTEVTFPISEYLALVEKAEAQAKAAELRGKNREKPVAEVAEEHFVVTLGPARPDGQEAQVDSVFEVLVQGEPKTPVFLPLPGYGSTATIEKLAGGGWGPAPGAALSAFSGGSGSRGLAGATFVAAEKGRYRIRAQSVLPAELGGGQIGLRLLQVAAPVASAEFDLPAELDWVSSGAVLVAQEVAAGRRRIKLATERGAAPALIARRLFAQGEEKALAQVVALTLVQLRPEGLRRHDVLLYEVARGQLSAFEVALPPGLEADVVATDEGLAVPIVAAGKLRVERRRQLAGTGYLVITSALAPQDLLALPPLAPEVEVRARFLAVASTIAAEIGPRPEAAFSQVDLTDLPALLGEALGAVDLAAAWRLQEGADAKTAALFLQPLPAAAQLAATVTRRDTTTLLTVDGTLLHREVFTLAPSDRPASSFEVALPAGATLWSTTVDGQPTRPLQRGSSLVLPILPQPGAATAVEVVSVLERAIPAGRSQLTFELAQVAAPVLDHRWRVLLPDANQYRFAAGELRPAPASAIPAANWPAKAKPAARPIPGAGRPGIAGRIVSDGKPLPGVTITLVGLGRQRYAVTGGDGAFLLFGDLPAGDYQVRAELEGFSTTVMELTRRDRDQAQVIELDLKVADVVEEITVSAEEGLNDFSNQLLREEDAAAYRAADDYEAEIGELQKGLVSGVKPLPVTIPESGKALFLTGILPPARVAVTLDVKARGK